MLSIRYCPEAVTPELVAWLQERVRYDADGRDSRHLQYHPLVNDVWRAVCPHASGFMTVILQAYRDGQAVTPCHSDLGSGGFILSIGATRTMRLHRVRGSCGVDYDLDVIKIECVQGMAVLMDEQFNAGWHHQIVPDEGAGERLSLVFRK